MGGIKHNKWYANPAEPRVARPDQNLMDGNAWAQWAAQEAMVTCKICGQRIVLNGTGAMGMMSEGGLDPANADGQQWKEEVEAGMHKDCYMKLMMAQHMRQNGNKY